MKLTGILFRFLSFFRWPKRRPSHADVLAAGLVPPPDAGVAVTGMNRAERRAAKSDARRKYEKERKKFDHFVQPQGEAPTKIIREHKAKGQPRKETADVAVAENDSDLIVEKFYGDEKTDVLYEEREFYGEFSFRDSILDQLDRYFVYLARMRRTDPDSFYLYRQVGATIVPLIGIADIREKTKPSDVVPITDIELKVSPWFNKSLPGFGCVAYGTSSFIEKKEEKTEKGKAVWIPKFLYFTKFARLPFYWQPMHGTIYKLTVWWDRPQNVHVRWGIPDEYGICVGSDGSLHALKTRRLPNGNIGKWHSWQWPNDLKGWARLHKTTPQDFICELFRSAIHQIETSSLSMARVDVERNGNHASFSVDHRKMPYFFKDRDYSLNSSGQRRRIFHSVRAHSRKDGASVPFHFRGERTFTWAGYNVHVTIPGLHHPPILEYAGNAYENADAYPRKEFRSEKYLGKVMRDELRK